MAISFAKIPPNLRVPLAYFEIDNTQAATQQQQLQLALMLGAVAPGAGLQINTPTLIRSADEARGLCGQGSALAKMAAMWFRNNASVPLYALAAANTGYTAGTDDITITGTATASGTIYGYIGGRLVRSIVAAGQTGAQIAVNMAAAINADPECGVTAVAALNVVTLTAIELGVLGNLTLEINYRGPIYGEVTPPGITIDAFDLLGGTGSPNLAALLANAGDGLYDFLLCPYALGADLDDVDEWLNDDTGRWSWQQQVYGHAFIPLKGTVATLSTFGNTRNGQHVAIVGIPRLAPSPAYEWMTAFAAQSAGSLIIDPARPVQSLLMNGILAPVDSQRFTVLERQILYFDGISCTYVDASQVVHIDRCITTYQRNVWGAPDNSYLDVETMYTAAYFNRFMRDRILLKFPRHKLANDGTQFGGGQAIVTPSIIKAEMVAAYGQLEAAGLMENAELFRQHLIVERNATDPNRVDVLLPPDFVNQLRIVAGLVQFRLQFAA